ncbi:hypothetical protein KUCAC02_030154 [Chaenocephalus aceratus]|uniref:Uncharacterized protein n=1 Tax=Chaenocephalus aceratus TaxID=36190 RepID=A0ACB9XHX6_CHAAC|nr:hypothetical protein KUCAC02_030154 [Chaenocephalus aceratus]
MAASQKFLLRYEDPDFGGQLSCLLDIQELPEKGTLKVVTSESDISSCASSDTDILPHVSVRERQKTWPDIFPLPTFSYEVEHVLGEGNSAFETWKDIDVKQRPKAQHLGEYGCSDAQLQTLPK